MAIEDQNVTRSKLATKEQNVVTLELKVGKLRLDEINFQCNLELAMVIVFNASGNLDYFKFYIN